MTATKPILTTSGLRGAWVSYAMEHLRWSHHEAEAAFDEWSEASAVSDWIGRTLSLPVYANPAPDSYGEGVRDTLRTVAKLMRKSVTQDDPRAGEDFDFTDQILTQVSASADGGPVQQIGDTTSGGGLA